MRRAVIVVAAWSACAGGLAQSACEVDKEPTLALINFMRNGGANCGTRGVYAPAMSLVWNVNLQAMAQVHAEGLASAGELRHTNEHGHTIGQRALAVGYRFARVGENLAQGQKSVDVVLRAWSGSETHCVNMYGPLFTETALACAHGADGRPVWVMVVARPR